MAESCHFDFDFHPWIREACRNHHGRGANSSEILSKHWPTLRKVSAFREDVCDSHHVFQARAGFLKRRYDVLQALLGLRGEIGRDRHRLVVEPCRARYEHPVALDNGTRVTDLFLECRPRTDKSPLRHLRTSPPGRRLTACPPILSSLPAPPSLPAHTAAYTPRHASYETRCAPYHCAGLAGHRRRRRRCLRPE